MPNEEEIVEEGTFILDWKFEIKIGEEVAGEVWQKVQVTKHENEGIKRHPTEDISPKWRQTEEEISDLPEQTQKKSTALDLEFLEK